MEKKFSHVKFQASLMRIALAGQGRKMQNESFVTFTA